MRLFPDMERFHSWFHHRWLALLEFLAVRMMMPMDRRARPLAARCFYLGRRDCRGRHTSTQGMLSTNWVDGKRLSFPAENPGSNMSVEGLLLARAADTVKSDVLPDGQSVVAVFHASDFSGNWLSTIDVTVEAQLTAHDLDLTVTAHNTGQQPAPFGVGWHPFFAIPSGDRANALLSVPSQTIMEVNKQSGKPTGRMVSVAGKDNDFSKLGGTKLGLTAAGATYTSLLSGVASGPVAELSDPSYNYRLSVIPLTPDITSMRVIAPADKAWVLIGPNTNLDDPFGAEWDSPENAGMITLAPGATLPDGRSDSRSRNSERRRSCRSRSLEDRAVGPPIRWLGWECVRDYDRATFDPRATHSYS